MTLDIREIYRATDPNRTLDLNNEEDRKFYIDFSPVRGHQIVDRLRMNIALLSPNRSTCQLLTGHIGCGKSTELLRLKAELEQEGFHVVYINSGVDLEMNDIEVSEILLMIALRVSESLKILNIPEPKRLNNLLKRASELVQETVGVSVFTETDQFLFRIAKIIAISKENPSLHHMFREYLEPRINTILEAINLELLATAKKKLKQHGKNGLVVIVDDLEKMANEPKLWGRYQHEYLFVDRGAQLRQLNCHVIYTIPIVLRFSNDFTALMQSFELPSVIPQVPVQLRDGSENKEGVNLLRMMVLARVFPNIEVEQRLSKATEVFDTEETLNRLCMISGGHLRILLRILNQCLLVERDLPISRITLEQVIREFGNEQTIAIKNDDRDLIRRVSLNKTVTGDKKYQILIRSLFIYEYRDYLGSWFDINPILPGALKLQEEEQILNTVLLRAQQFLSQTGAETIKRDNILRVTSVSGRLKSYAPLPVMFAEQPIDKDVLELKRQAAQLREANQSQTGLLLYRKQPDTLFRIRMAEVRLRDHFILIPIPLAAVEQALIDEATSTGLLAQYTKRYMPGADLFDDRNAIGDTLSFYGRSNLLHSLEDDLRRCQSIGLFGIRKSGKTSVLLQLGFSLRQHPVVYIDLQPYGGKLRYGVELFNEILKKLSNLLRSNSNKSTLGIELLESDCPAKEIATDFTRKVCDFVNIIDKVEYKLPIICFLDEIERILPTKADSKERVEEFNAFFGALRELSQTKKILSLLCADVHLDFNRINNWPQANVPTNPVFQFFKEVFILPFSQEETKVMLKEIGQLMGVEFDQELLELIYRNSGGHPFIARQLASLLYKKATRTKQSQNEMITLASANRYLKKPFKYLDILKDYFKKNIWADLEKNNFSSAMTILRLLACNEELEEGVAEGIILDRLNDRYTESECESALLSLGNVGLIGQKALDKDDYYRLQIQLMSRWLRREMQPEEVRQWQIHSAILD